MATPNRKASPPEVSLARRDGRELAVQLLHELEARDPNESPCALDPQYRPGPQDNIVLKYLDALHSLGSREATVGFSSIISDFIANCIEGTVPYAGSYEDSIEVEP